MLTQYPRAVCSLIIRDDGMVLATSRKDNDSIFGLPGGKVDIGDINLQESCARELKEETGLYPHIHSLIPVYSAICYGSDNKHYLTTTFMVHRFYEGFDVPRQIEGEGKVAWVSTDVMCRTNTGKYKNFGIYNRALFNHMNIYVPSKHEDKNNIIQLCDYEPDRIEFV